MTRTAVWPTQASAPSSSAWKWKHHRNKKELNHLLRKLSCFLVPTGAIRNPVKDTTFRGYNIPRSAKIYANLHRLNKDPKIWEEPEEFRPSRFLDEKLNLVNTEKMHPFGFGKTTFPLVFHSQFGTTCCRVPKGTGSQSVVRCVSTISGWYYQQGNYFGLQQSQAKLLSCVCLSWVHCAFTSVYLSLCLGVGVPCAYWSLWSPIFNKLRVYLTNWSYILVAHASSPGWDF